MGVLASDEKWSPFDTELPELPITNSNVVFLPNDWKPTPRQNAQTAVTKYNLKKRYETQNSTGSNLRLKEALIPTVALCEICANNPRFNSSSLCSKCIERRAHRASAPGCVIELSERDVSMAYFLIGLLIVLLFLCGVSSIKSEPVVNRKTVTQTAR